MERIVANSVVKKFPAHRSSHSTALGFASSIFSKKPKKTFCAVDSVSLVVKDGEKIGIIGGNGSGKSTLLRCLADIYLLDGGTVKTRGKVIYASGFNQGLNSKLTMRDNVFLIGSLHGVNWKILRKNFNEIVDFSGLEDYVDVKVNNFSDGMRARLNFSVAAFAIRHIDPDILLLDEVSMSTGGGDIDFKEKTAETMKKIMNDRVTTVFVSHDLESVVKNCNRTLWIHKGRVRAEGESQDVVDTYREFVQKNRKRRGIKKII